MTPMRKCDPRHAVVAMLLAAAAMWPAACRPLAAQCVGASCTITVQMPVSDVLRLTLSAVTTSLGTPVEADYTAGYVASTGPTATAKANRAYTVTVDATSANFTYSGSLTDPVKPASTLTWATTSGGPFTHNAGTAAALFTGSTGTSGTSQGIFFRTTVSYAVDRPGTYRLTVRYTLSAP